VTLYGKGEAVAVSYSSSTGSRSTYLGKDILGSVRTATTDTGAVEDRYEYDAFGTVYQGDLSGGMNLGYTGKPYDTATGLYNYGYRDYRPQAARFTTVDPIRDGNNWFAYVNNDPVNYIDLWGLQDLPITYAMKLAILQRITRDADMYQMGGGGRYPRTGGTDADSTFCNQATFDIAIATGFNQDALFQNIISDALNIRVSRDSVNANTAARNLAYASTQGTVTQVSGGRAQELADRGYTVIAAWENPSGQSGHLATVAPNISLSINSYFPGIPNVVNYPDNYIPLLSNVGANNGIMPTNEAFRKNTTPIYYYDPNQQFDNFDSSDVAKRKEQPKKGR
jgi:RHS repeat-associated protein